MAGVASNDEQSDTKSAPFVQSTVVSRHSVSHQTSQQQPVYGILPTAINTDVYGRPVYDLRALEDSESVVITYPVAVSYSPSPEAPNSPNLVDPASARFHYQTTVVSKGTARKLPAISMYEASSFPTRASSEPPLSCTRDRETPQRHTAPPQSPLATTTAVNACDNQSCDEKKQFDVDINATNCDQRQNHNVRRDAESSSMAHAGRTPFRPPIPHKHVNVLPPNQNDMAFPSPSSQTASPPKSQTKSYTAPRPTKPPLSPLHSNEVRRRYHYRYQPPMILASRGDVPSSSLEQNEANQKQDKHQQLSYSQVAAKYAESQSLKESSSEYESSSSQELEDFTTVSPTKRSTWRSQPDRHSHPKTNNKRPVPTKTSSAMTAPYKQPSVAKKRRHRRQQFMDEQQRVLDHYTNHPSPMNIGTSSSSEDPSDAEQRSEGQQSKRRKKKRKRSRKQDADENDHGDGTEGERDTQSIQYIIKHSKKQLKQSQIDEYLRVAPMQRESQCLLCIKKKLMPSHYFECPRCGRSYLDQTNANKNAYRNRNNPSKSNSIRLHPDIQRSVAVRKRFGLKTSSPPLNSLASPPPKTSQQDTQQRQGHTHRKPPRTARPPRIPKDIPIGIKSKTPVKAGYDEVFASMDREYQRFVQTYPELVLSEDEDVVPMPIKSNVHRQQQPASCESPHSPLNEEYDWIPVDKRHLSEWRRGTESPTTYPTNDTMIRMITRAYNKQYHPADIEAMSAQTKERIFSQILWNLRDAERFDLRSPIHRRAPSDEQYLSVLDKYKFKPQTQSESVHADQHETDSHMDVATASDSDHIEFENLRSPSNSKRSNSAVQKDDDTLTPSRDCIVLVSQMPSLSPVRSDDNEIIAFELPPPIPAAAEPPCAAATPPNILHDFVFEEKLRKTGVFGQHKLNRKDVNCVCVHFLFHVVPNKISVKCFYRGKETARSKAVHCVINGDNKICRYCQERKSHQACKYDQCNTTLLRYRSNSSDNKLWKSVSVSQGNNAMLLSHFYARHIEVVRTMRNMVVRYCQERPDYIATVLVGVHKYAATKQRRSMQRRQEQTEQQINAENESYIDILTQVSKGNVPPDNDKAQMHKTIAATWTVAKHIKIINVRTPGQIQSGCPRGLEKGETCLLSPDGTAPRKQAIFDLHRAKFVFIDRYKCKRHKYMKMSCTSKALQLVRADRFNYGLIRIGNGLLTTQFLSWLMAKYVAIKYRIRQLREEMTDEYSRTWHTQRNTQYSLKQIKDVMYAYIPSETTLNKYLRTGQQIVYSTSLKKQLSLLMRTNINAVGIDQTFGRMSKLKGDANTQANVGLATAVSIHSLILKLGILNNASENTDQLCRFGGELKGELLLHGNCEYLAHTGFFWGTDNYRNAQNLPTMMNQFLRDQIATNPNYSALKAKLAATNHTLDDFVDINIECGMHKFMRDYRCLKAEGITASTHGDFSVYVQQHINMMNGLQRGTDQITNLLECDWINLQEYDSKDGFVRAIAWYHAFREQLETDGLDKDIMDTLHQILQLESIQDFKAKNEAIVQLKASTNYTRSHEAMSKLMHCVHPQQRRWMLGRWLNGEDRIDQHWADSIELFQDCNGVEITVYTHGTTQFLCEIIAKFYMVSPWEFQDTLVLHPLTRWIGLQYKQLRDSVVVKRCESIQSNKPPLWNYPSLRNQWELASRQQSVDAMISARNKEFENIWLNVLNEQNHNAFNTIFSSIRGCQNVECNLQDLNVHQYELNDTKLTRLTNHDQNVFSNEFVAELKKIRIAKEEPPLFTRINNEGLIYDASNIYETLVQDANKAMEARHIDRSHNKVMKRAERMLLGKEVSIVAPDKITIDLVIALHCKYRKSVVAIIRELLRYGIPSDTYDTGEPITCHPGKIYEAIQSRSFKTISFLPKLDDDDNKQSATNSLCLPAIPSQYTTNSSTSTSDPSPPAIAPIIEIHSGLLKAVKHLNDNVPFLLVDIQKLHALPMQDYSLKEFMIALLDPQRRDRVWRQIFTAHQAQCIARFVGDMNNVHGLMKAAGVEYTNTELFDTSYALCHELQPIPAINALTLNLGGDARTNYRYDKKRCASTADLSEPTKKKKARKAAYKQVFKFNKKSNDYRKPIKRKCKCNYHEVTRKREFKFGAFLTGADCMNELKKISLYCINEGGKDRLKTYCIAHEWRETETHGQSASFLKDWIIAHLLLNKDITESSREAIEALFTENNLLKKSKKRRK